MRSLTIIRAVTGAMVVIGAAMMIPEVINAYWWISKSTPREQVAGLGYLMLVDILGGALSGAAVWLLLGKRDLSRRQGARLPAGIGAALIGFPLVYLSFVGLWSEFRTAAAWGLPQSLPWERLGPVGAALIVCAAWMHARAQQGRPVPPPPHGEIP
jgi:hypothetical protein